MDVREHPSDTAGQPSVGNVLGFSLLLRDRKAMLHLERRALAPGVRLVGYEAEVPGVKFPMKAQGAAAFRRRRCRVHKLGVEVEVRTLQQWLHGQLVGRSVAGLRIDGVRLELAAEVEPDLPPAPCLVLDGRQRGHRGWVMIALQLVPRGRALVVRPWRIWGLDDGAPDGPALWRELAARLGGSPDSETTEGYRFDPIRRALLPTFVGAGWRAPNLAGLAIDGLALGSERAAVSLCRPNAEGLWVGAVPEYVPTAPDRVQEHLRRAALARAEGSAADTREQIERLADSLPETHPARLAALRWLARLARREDPAQALRALRAWLHLRPRDAAASRALVLHLGTSGKDRALAQRLAAQCRLPHDPLTQGRLELALATVLLDRLEEPDTARGLLEPLLQRARDEPALAELRAPARTALALVLAEHHPQQAVAELERALSFMNTDTARASARAKVAKALARHGHAEDAQPLWSEVLRVAPEDDELNQSALHARALQHLPDGDPRRVEWMMRLAHQQLASADPAAAHEALVLLLDQPEIPTEALELLVRTAEHQGDHAAKLRALRGLLSRREPGPARHELELELARTLDARGQVPEALPLAAAATHGLASGSPAQVDAARLWARLAHALDDPRAEADARAALREALGPELPPEERRAEALLWAERLEQVDRAGQLIHDGLQRAPGDESLLAALEHLTHAGLAPAGYLSALETAIEGMDPGPARDRRLTTLALAAADAGDAGLAYGALVQLPPEATLTDVLLDLRDWATESLGIEGEALAFLDDRLVEGPVESRLLQRLAQHVGEGQPVVEHLLDLARDCQPVAARRLLEAAIDLGEPTAEPALWIQVLGHSLRVGARPAAETLWPALVAKVAAQDDDELIANLVSLAHDAEEAGIEVGPRVGQMLDEALARRPGSRPLHRATTQRLARTTHDPTADDEALARHLDALADRFEMSGAARAELFIGMAERLDRRAAAELLTQRAEATLDDAPGFGRLIEALEARHCWPEVLRLLAARIERIHEVDDEVATRKHLAHIAAEVLGDSAAAVEHLEAALALAPTDPDLLLALLDHHFNQKDLARAVELTEQVLDNVRMGDAAFTALAHRAADAAIAQDQSERATALLERIIERIPDDAKALARIDELHRRTDDPAQRVQLLAAVATRQGGKARIEALEERARLLLDPLDRPGEAMEDLAAVVAEAPDRRASAELLARLYREHERFEALVALHERELPRRHGEARARVLREIAEIHRDELYDLPQAEKALRLGIDQLDASPAQRALADELREELVANLERQGRFVDLAVYLEQELAPELAAEPDDDDPARPRLALLSTLARLLRDRLDQEAKAARIYEHLERWHALSDDGLATLARWYRRSQRHDDLVRVLQLRAQALSGERRAAVDLHIAELLDGPLARPHEAAPYYLDAFTMDPEAHAAAGTRARVLLTAVDSVVNVRDRLLRRIADLEQWRRPPVLTLLADVLALHHGHEGEAEACYRKALALAPQLAAAHEGLGRLLSRRGRTQEAAEALLAATEHDSLPADRLAETAALAARNLIELTRFPEAEAVLRKALTANPDSSRALLELARLYERIGRRGELSQVLERLSRLPLSSTMLAEVAHRRALLLEPIYAVVPNGPQGERARSLLVEALGIDPRHTAARRALLQLATARGEWSIVAHMHYLAIRELPPGAQRAIAHLDLAATQLDHLGDRDGALRNLESAIQQAATDVVVVNRTAELVRRIPDPRTAAERFENLAAAPGDLDDAARARLWLLAADLRLEDDDKDAAAAASQRVLDLPSVPQDATAAATRALQRVTPHDDRHLAEEAAALEERLELEPPAAWSERVALLGRLHDLGRSLGDEALVERAALGQRQLATLIEGHDAEADGARARLRDLLTARGEYGPVVELYEHLAAQARDDDPAAAAAALVEAAGFAWRGLSEPARAATLLGRALRLRPDDEAALSTLRELVHETSEPDVATAILGALGEPDSGPRSPALSLLLATLAITRGDDDEALVLLRPLTAAQLPESVRLPAMTRLELLLAERGEQDERRQLLGELLQLAREREEPRVADLGLELARLQRAAGDRVQARRSCELARELAPEHRGLLGMLAELAEFDETWDSLVGYYEQLAQLAPDDQEQARWLTRAAKLYLDHPELTDDDAEGHARRLLLRACEAAPQAPEPRVALLPLDFRQARWDEVLEHADELVRLVGDDEEVLVLGAVAEAYRRGELHLAREIGYRHSGEVARRLLLPGLQKALDAAAHQGPLPRLDDLLEAGSTLTGGRRHLFDSLVAWASEHPNQAGLSLGLARLYEAQGTGDMARHHYQLAAFMAVEGPVPALVERLPQGRLSDPDIHRASTAPMQSRSTLRETLAELRDHLAGLGNEGAPPPASPHAPAPRWWHGRMELAETIVEPWRAILGVDLPLAWTDAPIPGGVAVRNDRPPRVLLGDECASLGLAEMKFRLAMATATVALGTAVLAAGSLDLGVLLDAMAQLANPGHQPTGVRAQLMADVLAARDARNIGLTNAQRASLADELAHWLTSDDGLARLDASLRRSRLLIATRMSGRLDGALLTIARDHGLLAGRRLDATTTLRQDDADWLLRALSLR